MYTLLPVNPCKGWQACREITGWAAQYAVTGPHTHAVESEHGTIHHGEFDADRARAFARSMGGPANRVIEVAPYYYCFAWGKVPAESVGPVDVARSSDWQHPIAPGTVLGTGEVVV
jgi:hypothetical protein